MPKKTVSGKVEKMGKDAKKTARKVEKRMTKCIICGATFTDSVEAVTHMLDHGSSILSAATQMVKDQREGNIKKGTEEKETVKGPAKKAEKASKRKPA